MTQVIGIDAASGWTGAAAVSRTGAELRPLRWLDDLSGTWSRRIVPLAIELTELVGGPVRVVIERPPPTTRAKGRQGSQAVVGFGIGVAWGMLAAAFLVHGHQVAEIEVAAWHRTRDTIGRRLGVSLPAGAGQGLQDVDKARSDRQKAFSWAVAHRLWRDEVDRVATAAADRARGERPPWRLGGVADACEAGLIAMHELTGGAR